MKTIHKDCKVGCWRGMGIHFLSEENVIVDSNMQLVVCERDESVRHIVFETQSFIKLTHISISPMAFKTGRYGSPPD